MSQAVRIDAKFATPQDVADTLGVPSDRAKKLANLVASRTAGSKSRSMKKSKVIAYLSEKVSTKDKPVSKKQAAAFCDELFNLAVKECRVSGKFVIPGIGRAVKARRKSREGRNPVIRATNKPKTQLIIAVSRKRRARATVSKSTR
jgi:DNA-binding protein HU-beta